MTTRREIGVGVIALGFMGRAHVRAYEAARAAGWPCRLRAVCDSSSARLQGRDDAGPARGNLETTDASSLLFDPASVAAYSSADALLRDPGVDLVSICTPTDSHVELATAALNAGKHVLVEKPVSLSSVQIEHLAALARAKGRVCMPAMCMRFWPGWDWLRKRVRSGAWGTLRSLTLTRLGSPPGWSAFYLDLARSGGALFDLHVHDVDFLIWCLGKPVSVRSAGSPMHVTTLYQFEQGPTHVTAEGGWTLHPSAGFRMAYRAVFERAVAEFDLAKEPRVSVFGEAGETGPAPSPLSGYDGQVRHLIDVLSAGGSTTHATLDDAALAARVLEAERESLRTAQAVPV